MDFVAGRVPVKTRALAAISAELAGAVDRLRFAAPVSHVYNPLGYARAPHEDYLTRHGGGRKEVVLLGMNPGPFGMAQTGVPFGDVVMVRDFLGVAGAVGKPPREHGKRPVTGFGCTRSEVSGTRLWGWVKHRFVTPEVFFARFFVVNYCPLCFMDEGGRNVTPDKLPAAERGKLYAACDEALRKIIKTLQPRQVVGIGGFAETRAREALGDSGIAISTILHPSPASPAANQNWQGKIEAQLRAAGIAID